MEVFARECRTLPAESDIMGMRGTYHKNRVLELVERFNVWRQERLPGVRAFQSTYDRFSFNSMLALRCYLICPLQGGHHCLQVALSIGARRTCELNIRLHPTSNGMFCFSHLILSEPTRLPLQAELFRFTECT